MECDCAAARRRGVSQVGAVLLRDSCTSRARLQLVADNYLRTPCLQPAVAAKLMGLCRSPAEVDDLLHSGLLNCSGEVVELKHTYHGDAPVTAQGPEFYGEGKDLQLRLGWVPPPLDSEVAAAAITILLLHGSSTAAWHVLWRSVSTSSGPQAWQAIAKATVRQGSALPALHAVRAASDYGVHIAQRTLLKLCAKLAASTTLTVCWIFLCLLM